MKSKPRSLRKYGVTFYPERAKCAHERRKLRRIWERFSEPGRKKESRFLELHIEAMAWIPCKNAECAGRKSGEPRPVFCASGDRGRLTS